MKPMSLPQQFDHIPTELLFAYLEKDVPRRDECRMLDHFKMCPTCRQEVKLAYYILSAFDDMAHKNRCKRLAAESCSMSTCI